MGKIWIVMLLVILLAILVPTAIHILTNREPQSGEPNFNAEIRVVVVTSIQRPSSEVWNRHDEGYVTIEKTNIPVDAVNTKAINAIRDEISKELTDEAMEKHWTFSLGSRNVTLNSVNYQTTTQSGIYSYSANYTADTQFTVHSLLP